MEAKEFSIRPNYDQLIFKEKKINLKVKTLSIINDWYLNLRYLCFLDSNDLKCSYSKPTIRCTLKALTLRLGGNS